MNPSTTQDLVSIAFAGGLPVLHCPAEVMHIDFWFIISFFCKLQATSDQLTHHSLLHMFAN